MSRRQGGHLLRIRGPTQMRMPQVMFQLANQLRLSIATGDITKITMDGIVNAANERMLGGGGVDGAIHRAAGDSLYEACKRVSEVRRGVRCPTGEARITPGFDLPSKHVIHTVGPIYEGDEASAPLLRNAHMSSLELASENGLETVAFPAISCGVYGYPIKKAARIAVQTCKEFSEEKGGTTSVKSITFLLFGQDVYDAWVKAAAEVLTPVQPSAAHEPPTAEKKEQKPASDGVSAAKDDSMESDAKKARTATDAEGDGGEDTKPETPQAAKDVAEDGSREDRIGKPAVKGTEAEQDTIALAKVEAKEAEQPLVQSGTGDVPVHGQVDSKESKLETVDAVDTKPETDMEITDKDSGENTRQGPS